MPLGETSSHRFSALSVQVLYKQNWEDTKDKYLLPPDAPELVQAIKNTAMFSKVGASALLLLLSSVSSHHITQRGTCKLCLT